MTLHPILSVTVLRRFRDAGKTTLRSQDLSNRNNRRIAL
jgi:hypothetical protein